jgi:DNA topoisomerase-2
VGYSTDILSYNPSEIISKLKDRLTGCLASLKPVVLKPWWQGFKGAVIANGETAWMSKGIYSLNDDKCTITITELPIGTWTSDYKEFLDTLASANSEAKGALKKAAFGDNGKLVLQGFDELYTDEEVKFVLYLEADYYEDVKADIDAFEARFKLRQSHSISNMHAFDEDMCITKFSTVGGIMEAFYGPRLAAYEVRREKEIERLEAEAVEADAKARFIKGVLEGNIELRRKSDEEIIKMMIGADLPGLSKGEEGSIDTWEYLLRMRMDRVKANAVKDQEEAAARALGALEELQGTTAKQLWLNDLDEFESSWNKLAAVREADATSASINAGKARAKIAAKGRGGKSKK